MLRLRGHRLPSPWVLLLWSLLLLLLPPPPAVPAPHRASYKPVIVVHGLFDSSYSFRHLLEYINEVGRERRLEGFGGVWCAEGQAGKPAGSCCWSGEEWGGGAGRPWWVGRAAWSIPSGRIAPFHRHILGRW